MTKISIAIFSSSAKALPALKALIKDKNLEINSIVTALPKRRGRDKQLTPNPIALFAQQQGIKCLELNDFQLLSTDYCLLITDLFLILDFDLLLPPEWFNHPKNGTLNLHFSLLPKYRGPAPVQWALIKGETESGISLIKINDKFDHGPIVYQRKFPIDLNDTAESLYVKLWQETSKILGQTIKQYIKGNLKSITQPVKSPTAYARRLTKTDGFVAWHKLETAMKGTQANRLHNLIRGLHPWPGAYTTIQTGKKEIQLKILCSKIENNCLVLETVQLSGKSPISFKAFIAGHPNLY
ncbi:methionyl-tRNA formyltransferase [Patescibacteria group bacterium]|nr:methionyl-tRNA formyltransferase [Patescibacteria group bacterium]MBU1931143.1 methionyl-tRNA formyltransferase [Patescibacteria group bacterium]